MNNIPSVAERNEIIQDIIDRLLYLPDADRTKFIYYLDILKDVYQVNVRNVDGIRIYETQKQKP
jgi:hypothetical protein